MSMSTVGNMMKCSRRLLWKPTSTVDSFSHVSVASTFCYNQRVALFTTSATERRISKNHHRDHVVISTVLDGQRVALFSTSTKQKRKIAKDNNNNGDDHWSPHRVSSFVGHSFPDFIEKWNRDNFRRVGYGLAATTVATLAGSWALYDFAILYHLVTPAVLGTVTAAYWKIGLRDIQQKSHAIRRNYPVLGNIRYIAETVRLVTTPWTFSTCIRLNIYLLSVLLFSL